MCGTILFIDIFNIQLNITTTIYLKVSREDETNYLQYSPKKNTTYKL